MQARIPKRGVRAPVEFCVLTSKLRSLGNRGLGGLAGRGGGPGGQGPGGCAELVLDSTCRYNVGGANRLDPGLIAFVIPGAAPTSTAGGWAHFSSLGSQLEALGKIGLTRF